MPKAKHDEAYDEEIVDILIATTLLMPIRAPP